MLAQIPGQLTVLNDLTALLGRPNYTRGFHEGVKHMVSLSSRIAPTKIH